MIQDDKLPNLSQLYDLINAVRNYPVSARDLVNLADSKGADKRVVDFYGSFDPEVTFSDSDDLATQSEAIEIMHETKQPVETSRSPQS